MENVIHVSKERTLRIRESDVWVIMDIKLKTNKKG